MNPLNPEEIQKLTKESYDTGYKTHGVNSQRRYPNEELVRFISRNFQGIDKAKRKDIKILEVGCGSCGNLWMIAREGFSTIGLDISPSALQLAKEVLAQWSTDANLVEGSMEELPFETGSLDAVVDIVASFSLLSGSFSKYIHEVARVLKPGGRFFIFTLSVASDAFKNFAPAVKIEENTLNGIYRKDSPYYGCFYPHRFYDVNKLSQQLQESHLRVEKKELVTRTYRNLGELFEFISIEAVRF